MKTMFLTAENRKQLPPLYSQEKVATEDHMVYVKFFHPYGAGTWLAMEFDGKDQFFGAVKIHDDWELGYFSLAELSSLKAKINGRTMPFQAIERDRYFKPMPYSKAKAA